MPKKPPAPTITITPELAAALDKLVTIKGVASRYELVQSALESYVRYAREKADAKLGQRTVYEIDLPLTKEEGHTPWDDAPHLLRVQLAEHGLTSNPRKNIFIQSVSPTFQGGNKATTLFVFPVSKIPRVKEFLLPWLSQALSEAENVHKVEVNENRAAAQAKRRHLTPEEKAKETAVRTLYSEKYGKEVWENAVSQANRHRVRASRRNLTEHFTAQDWIDLADRQGFRCAECQAPHAEEPLETHHALALMHGGMNTIANIRLVCVTCHVAITEHGDNHREEWHALELEMMSLLAVGDTAGLSLPSAPRTLLNVDVLEVIAPVMGAGPLRCKRVESKFVDEGDIPFREWYIRPPYPLVRGDYDYNGYAPTRLRVRWTDKKGKVKEKLVRPWFLSKVTT